MPMSSAFAAPPLNVQNATVDSPIGAWAPSLRLSADGIPDARQQRQLPLRTMYPPAGTPPQDYYRPLNADWARRHSVESTNAGGMQEHRPLTSGRPQAPNPRSVAHPVGRVTAELMPRNYFFMRPFGLNYEGTARHLSGQHFSMADHVARRGRNARPTEGTMAAPKAWRNTFRLDPTPWDAGSGDLSPDANPPMSPGRITVHDLVPTRAAITGSWRL